MKIQEVIYKHLVEQEKSRLIYSDNCEKTEIGQENLDNAILDTKKRLAVRLQQGKCSHFLIEQIARHRLNKGEKFNHRVEFYNASELIDVIGLLENDKINHTDFNGEILKGFSKTHHGTYSGIGHSVVRNIKEYWFKKGKIRNERKNEFEQIKTDFESHGISSILNTMHSKAIRNKDLRGEWIIFKKHKEIKYYLCLACHYEEDKSIFGNKLKNCFNEFPELNL
jgi:hypothetical protein